MHRKKYISFTWIFFLFFLVISRGLAQSEVNPFDIGTPAIKSDSTVSSNTPNVSNTLSDNPFDIIPSSAIPNENATQTIKPKEVITTTKVAEKPQSFLFGLVLGILLLLTILVSLSRNLISKIYQGFFNDIILKALQRERGSLNTTVYISLYTMFIINFGVFLYLTLLHYGILFNNSNLLTLLYCIIGIGLIIVSKHLVLSFLSFVFPVSKEIDTYSFIILIFGILIGLVLAPINVFFAYADPKMATYIVFGTVIFLILIYSLQSLRSLFLARNYIFPHFFHFLLYLCSVEIIPLLLLYKTINTKLQIPIF